MTKEELIEKLTALYETGKSDWHTKTYDDVEVDRTAYISEIAENILKSFPKA